MPLLTGLTADGTEVPVQVEPDGVLVAEGIQGAPGVQGPVGPEGPQGPQGPPGPAGAGGISAWGNFDQDATLLSGNKVASVQRTTAGDYVITLSEPMQSINYAVIASSFSPNAQLRPSDNTTSSFRIVTSNAAGTKVDSAVNFIVVE